MLKWSKYNFYKKNKNGDTLIYNTCSGGMYLLEKRNAKLLRNLKKLINNSNYQDEIKKLKDEFYLVDFDEQKMLEHQFNLSSYDSSTLGLTICPTMKCNLACTYCYENKLQDKMSDETIENLIEFVKLKTKNCKTLSVTWYGGEPLFETSVLLKINAKLMQVVKEQSINYNAFMITNATLINEKTIKVLEELNVKNVQVTLDGAKGYHDSRRITSSGAGTYDIIVKKLKLLNNAKIGVSLRINVDKDNIKSLDELLDDLAKNGIKAGIYLGHIQANTESFSNCNICLKKSEFNLVNYNFIKTNQEKYKGVFDFNTVLPEKKNIFCGAEKENSFVVDSQGYAYKCWNEVGIPNRAVLNVNNFKDINYKNLFFYHKQYPFALKCKSCKMLPICMGGCPYNRCFYNNGKCSKYKEFINIYLENFIKENNL